MLSELISHVAKSNALTEETAKSSIGIILNAAMRQGSDFAEAVFQTLPGARALSARSGSEVGAATGVIALLIEQTPGGKRHVAQKMILDLQNLGLDHKAIGHLLPSISTYMESAYGLKGYGHLGDLIGTDLDNLEIAMTEAA